MPNQILPKPLTVLGDCDTITAHKQACHWISHLAAMNRDMGVPVEHQLAPCGVDPSRSSFALQFIALDEVSADACHFAKPEVALLFEAECFFSNPCSMGIPKSIP